MSAALLTMKSRTRAPHLTRMRRMVPRRNDPDKRSVVTRRGRWKTVCARGACQAVVGGRSTSPLVAVEAPWWKTLSRIVWWIFSRLWAPFMAVGWPALALYVALQPRMSRMFGDLLLGTAFLIGVVAVLALGYRYLRGKLRWAPAL